MENDIEPAVYSEFVRTLFKKMGTHEASCMHAAIGIAGEGGELLDAIKKVWIYNRILDVSNVVEELGDLEFYMEALRGLVGVTRGEVLYANMEKLKKRYHEGKYTDKAAQERADKG
jgi:NTP pyrophosphatase (non-canonical NTP hydrolase)